MRKNILLSFYCLLMSTLVFGKSAISLSANSNDPKDSYTKKEFNTTLAVSNPYISSGNGGVYCGSGFTLYANPYNPSYTYQWLFSTTETGTYTNISGATSYFFSNTATTNIGYYKVAVNDATTPVLSPSFRVRQGATATLVSASPSTITAGQSTTLNLTFSGTGPWSFSLYGNNGAFVRDYTSTTATLSISNTPDSYRSFYIGNVYDGNGAACGSGQVGVFVNPAPILTFDTPPTTSVCAGNTFEVPFTRGGTWGNINNSSIDLALTTTTGAVINSSWLYDLNGNPVKYLVPLGTPLGIYKIRATGFNPYLNPTSTSYNVSVVSTGCVSNQAIIIGKNSMCAGYLNGYPQGAGYTYQWYKDNVLVSGVTNSFIYLSSASQSGNYTVRVTNTDLSFSATSAIHTASINGFMPQISTTSNTLCGVGGTTTLTSNYTGVDFTYQWYKSTTGSGSSTTVPLFGETNASITVGSFGNYFLKIWDGTCPLNSNSLNITACPPTVASTNPIICGANTQAVLQSSTNSANIYQWSSSTSEFGSYTPISGATSSSYTATATGYYKVANDAGTLSNAFRVNNAPYAVLSNSNGNTNSINIAPGGTAAITYKLFGAAPFTFTAFDNVNTRTVYSPTDQITLNSTPPSSRYHSAYNIAGAGCTTTGNSQNSIVVNVGAVPSIAFGPFASTICAGDVLSVPYTLTGVADSNISMIASLYNATTNAYVTSLNSSSTNPLQFQIPVTLAAGVYKILVGGNLPYFGSTFTNNFTVTSACMPTAQASIQGYSSVCSGASLNALPNGTGYNFEWRRNGSVVTSGTSSFYYGSVSGNYTVVVTNASTGYNSTSPIKTLAINSTVPLVNSPNASMCGTNTSVTITSSSTGPNYTFLWQRLNTTNFIWNTIAGQTSQSLTLTQTSEVGQYRVIVNDGNCENTSNSFTVSTSSSARLLNSSGSTSSANLPAGQTENLQLQLNGQSPWAYTFRGINYTSNSASVTLPVSPSVTTNYNVTNVASNGTACGTTPVSSNTITVNIVPNLCPTLLTLSSPTDDYASGSVAKQASATTGVIVATNKITGTANVTYQAGQSITLNPGFKADGGAVFKTQFGGCN